MSKTQLGRSLVPESACQEQCSCWLPIPTIAPIAPFGRNGIRVGATGLWNGRNWQIGPPLLDGSDLAAIPGSPFAWMVGAWPAPRTGLTAEVRLSR
jgi:hypothetical protein